MNKEVVKELIQEEMNAKNLIEELQPLLYNNENKLALQKDYAELKRILSAGGHASSNAAKIIYNFIKN